MQISFKRTTRSLLSLLLAFMMLFSVTTTASAGNNYTAGTYSLGTFSFTGSNGGYYHTYSASKVRIGISHRALDAEKGHYNLSVSLVKYGGEVVKTFYMGSWSSSADNIGNFHTFISDELPIVYGADYRLLYTATNQGGNGEPRNLQVRVALTLSN